MEGRVWRVPALPEEVAELEGRFTVTNIQQDDAGISLRVLSDSIPTPLAVRVTPTLEDCCLRLFAGEESK